MICADRVPAVSVNSARVEEQCGLARLQPAFLVTNRQEHIPCFLRICLAVEESNRKYETFRANFLIQVLH